MFAGDKKQRTMNLVEKAKEYAISKHLETNHKYGEHPYSYHYLYWCLVGEELEIRN